MQTPDEKLDHTPITFGKYRGKTPSEIADADPGYIIWCYEAWAQGGRKPPCSKLLYKACQADEDRKPAWRSACEDGTELEDQPDPFGIDPNR